MTSKSKDHAATPGKAVPEAIGSRGHEERQSSEAGSHGTTPGEASEKLQHEKNAKSGTDKARNIPGKAVPDAIQKGKR